MPISGESRTRYAELISANAARYDNRFRVAAVPSSSATTIALSARFLAELMTGVDATTLHNRHLEGLPEGWLVVRADATRLPTVSSRTGDANLDRFTGFADLYDANRPSPPVALGPLLARYCGAHKPLVVDLGSGTGLSSRWAAGWAGSVIGVEPNHSMREQAVAMGGERIAYVDGHSSATGLREHSANVVLAVQAMHWMEPQATLVEVDRLLRPGGVFATVDADWPPVTGVTNAEAAWAALHKRIRVLEARIADGATDESLRAPINEDDPALVHESLSDPHNNRKLPSGVRSWSKEQHLHNITASQRFAFTREVVFDQPTTTNADKFIALIRSQGSYQDLRKRGLSDSDIGMIEFELAVRQSWRMAGEPTEMSFSWRVRLGVKPSSVQPA